MLKKWFYVVSVGSGSFMPTMSLEHVTVDPGFFWLFSYLCLVLKMVHVVFKC